MAKNNRYTIKTKEFLIEPADEEDVWEGIWNITLKLKDEKPVHIGTATFAGEKLLGAVPLRVDLEQQYTNKGYGTEVFKLMVGFAFGFRNIYEVKAVADMEDDKCVHALEKSGFVYRGAEHHIGQYSVTKQKSAWLGLYVYIGIICGLAIGIMVGNQWVGLVIGIVIGLFLGGVMENEEKKRREKITGTKD